MFENTINICNLRDVRSIFIIDNSIKETTINNLVKYLMRHLRIIKRRESLRHVIRPLAYHLED